MLQPISNKKLNFIVVGTGRCGTVYFAKLLTAVGIPCSHERIFNTTGPDEQDSDVSRWAGLEVKDFLLAEASYMAVPFLGCDMLKNAAIIHVVRDPLKVILSFNNKLQFWHHQENKWETFIASYLPKIRNYDTPLDKNCYYVVRWNRWIEEQAKDRDYIRVRLEHDEDKLLDFLHVPQALRPNMEVANAHESWLSKHSSLASPMSEKEIMSGAMADEVAALRLDYGYEV